MRRRSLFHLGLGLGATAALGACVPRSVLLAPSDGNGSRGYVLLLRGMGNIFSTGIDTLAGRVAAAGFEAEVRNHTAWRSMTDRLIADDRAGRLQRPFALIGHSLGADDAIRMCAALHQAGIRADLLLTIDPTLVDSVPAGARRVVNVFQTHDIWGGALTPGPGFDGTLENIDVTDGSRMNHFNIHKDDAVHARAIAILNTLVQAPAAAPARAGASPQAASAADGATRIRQVGARVPGHRG